MAGLLRATPGEPLFEELGDGLGEGLFVAVGDGAAVEDVFFEGVDPVVDDFAECAGWLGGGGETFGEPPVDGFEPVEWGFGFGDLDFGDGESGAFGAFGEPAGEEGFSGAVFAADGFEACAARGHGCEFAVEHGFVPVEADSEPGRVRCVARCRGGARRGLRGGGRR